MTIKNHAAKYGARSTARNLINQRVLMLTGLTLSDLPDTAEICASIDELEGIISTDPENINDIKEILKNIDIDGIESDLFD